MCEIQGAQEDFARRWERCFSDYPDLLTDAENKEQVQKYMERVIAYLQTVKAGLSQILCKVQTAIKQEQF